MRTIKAPSELLLEYERGMRDGALAERTDWEGGDPTPCRLDPKDRCATIRACHNICQRFAGCEQLSPIVLAERERLMAMLRQPSDEMIQAMKLTRKANGGLWCRAVLIAATDWLAAALANENGATEPSPEAPYHPLDPS